MIPQPEITSTIAGYDFSWSIYNIIIRVRHIHVSPDRITGEVEILFTQDEKPATIYPPTQINFLADQTRRKLARSLTDKMPLPWEDIVNQLCFGVQDRARRGEAVLEHWTSEDVPELEYLLEPILIKGVPTIIFGEKGVAKSTLSHVIYLCLALPWHDNPLGWIAPSRSINTLILDYELPEYIARRNLKKLADGMGIGPVPLYHRRSVVPLAQEVEQVAGYVAERKIEVLIIDSLARACGGELVKTEPANAFFEALDKLNVTPLILAQTSKDMESKRKTIYGNALFTYYARSIFELCLADSISTDAIDIGLFHRWSNLTARQPNASFHISYNGSHTTIESQAVSMGDFLAKIGLKKAIFESLSRGALTARELMEKTGGSSGSIKNALTQMKKNGTLIQLENDKWGIITLASRDRL